MFANGFEQTGEQEFAGGMGARQETGDQILRALAFPFLAWKARRIEKGPIGFTAVEKPFLEEAIERGHNGGVSEWPAKSRNYIADVTFASGPEKLHQFEFEGAERKGLALVGVASGAILEEANHGGPHVTTVCRGSTKPEYAGDFCSFFEPLPYLESAGWDVPP